MDRELRDRRTIVAAFVWGDHLERAADDTARELTNGLNARDVLLLAALAYDRDGHAFPTDLVGPVHTTSAGVSGSLRRLEAGGLITRDTGDDRRTRPVALTDRGRDLVNETLPPWQDWFESQLTRLDDNERHDLYRLLMKASGIWDDIWD